MHSFYIQYRYIFIRSLARGKTVSLPGASPSNPLLSPPFCGLNAPRILQNSFKVISQNAVTCITS